ncbi:MAG: mechanosensitive ion channel family protein [bacterium]
MPREGAPPREIEALIRRLEDPGERAALLSQLRLLLEAQRAKSGVPPAPAPAANLYARSVQRLRDAVLQSARAVRSLPRKARGLLRRVRGALARGDAPWALLRFLAALALALAVFFALRRLLDRLLPDRGAAGEPAGWGAKLARAARRWVERVLPAGALLAGGSLLAVIFGLGRTGEALLLIFLWALFIQRLILGGAAALSSPERPGWRLLPLSDVGAAYLSLWSRRFVLVWVWGRALADAAAALQAGPAAAGALANLYRFILLLQALVLVFQQRERVRTLLAVREPEGAGGAIRLAIAAWNIGAARWHFLAVPYLVVFFFLWSAESLSGLRYLLTSTLLTALILAAALALSRLVRFGARSLFAVSERLKRLVPGIEARANRYTFFAEVAVDAAVWSAALLLALDAWGIPTIEILFSEPGVRALGSLAGIGLTVAVAAGVVEGARAISDYFLGGRRDEGGAPIAPSPQQLTLLPLGYSVVKWVVTAVAGIIILDFLGVNIGPVLAGAGILGLAVGFGAQSLVKDVITGIFMLIEDNIAVGDVIRVKDVAGLVEGFNLRSVRLRDYEGNVHVVPNSAIDVVTNFTKEYSRSVFDIGVAYREDTDEVIEVIREVGEEMRADPEWADIILQPIEIAGLDRFADSSIVIRGRFKTKPLTQWNVRREFHRRIKRAFDARGIEIPFPYRTLTWAEPKPDGGGAKPDGEDARPDGGGARPDAESGGDAPGGD